MAPLCCPGAAQPGPPPHVRAPLLQLEPAVDHRAYACVLHEAVRGGNHSLARVLISGASLETLLMSDTQGRGFLHALGRVPLATSMLLQCPLLPQSHGHHRHHLPPCAGGRFIPPCSTCIIVRHDGIATRVLDLVITAAEKYTPHAWTAVTRPDGRCCCVVLSDSFDLVLELANRGINIDEKDNQGQTALHLAIDVASARERSGERAHGPLGLPRPGLAGCPLGSELRPLYSLFPMDECHACCHAQRRLSLPGDTACQQHQCMQQTLTPLVLECLQVMTGAFASLSTSSEYSCSLGPVTWWVQQKAANALQQSVAVLSDKIRCHVHLMAFGSKQVAHASLYCQLV